MNTYTEVLAAFNEVTSDVTRYHFTAAQVDRFANRALEEICERARYDDTQQLINIVGDTAVYTASAAAYDVFRVEYDGVALMPISRNALRHADRDWSSRTGKPKYFYLDEIYSSQDYLSVGLWETPSTSLSSGLRLWYHAVPNTVSAAAGSLEIEIPDWAVGAMLFYMLYLAFTADTKIQSFDSAAIYKLLYEDILARLIVRSRDRQPKAWVSGAPSGPSLSVLNRLPQRITE